VQRLARAVPRQTALAIILLGEGVSAARLHQLGLVTEVVPGAEVMARALATAHAILARPRAAVLNAKLLYELAADAPIGDSLRFGRAWGEATLGASAPDEVRAFARRETRFPEGAP
jgi:enoyl-CoA hydratase/carnithine racemase